MKQNYENPTDLIKALSDANRLQIIDILSCGEKCACDILEAFDFSQPTLSHHMKVLVDCELVTCRTEGLWRYYSLNNKTCNKLNNFLKNLTSKKDACICNNKLTKCK